MKKNPDCGDFDAVKMVRKIRNRYYKITKNMTAEERTEYNRQQLEEYNRYAATLNPDDFDFSFLNKK
jgi:hypothetical protein